MTDDSEFVRPDLDFRPSTTPHGTLHYDLNILTPEQQSLLNEYKVNEIRETEKYLAKHPEIRALIILAVRSVLVIRPRTDIREHIGNFFSQPRADLENAMLKYIKEREPHVYEGDSAVDLFPESTESIIEDEKEVSQDVLETVLHKTFERLGVDMTEEEEEWNVEEVVEKAASGESIVKHIIEELLDDAVSEEDREVLGYLLELQADVDDEIDNDIGDKMDDKIDKNLDGKIDDNKYVKMDDKIDEKIVEKMDEKLDDKIENKIEETIVDKVDEKVDDQIVDMIDQKIDEK